MTFLVKVYIGVFVTNASAAHKSGLVCVVRAILGLHAVNISNKPYKVIYFNIFV